MISRRGLIAGLMAGWAMPVLAEAPVTSPRPVPRGGKPRPELPGLESLVTEAKLGGVTGLVVLDAASGAVIEAFQPDALVPPASVAKTITALFALDRLGPGYRFVTRLLATGPVVQGVVQGDLVLAGGGDPVLDTDDLGDMAAALKAAGVKGVTGRYRVWAAALPAIERISDDQPVQVGYNPAISGLNLNFNRVNLEWKRAGSDWSLSMDARGERFLPPVGMARARVARREVPIFTYERDGTEELWTVASAALGKGGSRWLPVRQPALYAGEVFRTLAAAQGIDLPEAVIETAGPMPGGLEVVRHESEPLEDVLRDMLRHSTNLTAEVVGLTASGQPDLFLSAREMSAWAAARLGMVSSFGDHSGLGIGSRVTPQDMARGIAAALRTPGGAILPGILRDVKMRDAKGVAVEASPIRVVAKSGTLNFVSGLAGVIAPPGGRQMVFAVFSADAARREAIPVEEREEPPGISAWLKRARGLQGKLIHRWGTVYG